MKKDKNLDAVRYFERKIKDDEQGNQPIYRTGRYKLAVVALLKQVPKKVLDNGHYFCPVCERPVHYQYYCHCCGQALKFPEDAEWY